MRLAVDRTLAGGRYRLRRRLATGGMASVWLAHDERLGRDVAIKLIADTLADDPAWLERFEREARAAASVSHPHVVPVFDFGVEDERPYLVMAYIDGPSLAQALARGHRLNADRLKADRIARELLSAVAAVHAAGIVHRDIKPANVLLDRGGGVHLTDFGIAQFADTTGLTQTGLVIGTRSYLAPEVAAGEPATIASDLYSVGRVLSDAFGATGAGGALTAALTAADPVHRPSSAARALEMLAEQTAATQVRRVAASPGAWTPVQRTRARTVSPGIGRAIVVAAVILVLIVFAVVAAGGGGGGPSHRAGTVATSPSHARGAVPRVPAAGAPLSAQLNALDAAVNRSAAGR